MKRAVPGIMVTIVFVGMVSLAFDIEPVRMEPTTIVVPDDYPTVQDAINAASPGGTIFVRNGTYYEHLTISKSDLTLIGANRSTTVIDGNNAGTVVSIGWQSNVVMKGFTIKSGGSSQRYEDSGVYITDSSSIVVSDNIIDNNGYNGVIAITSSNVSVSDNIVSNNYRGGVIMQSCSAITIFNNSISNNGLYPQVWVFSSPATTISYNKISSNNRGEWGIGLRKSGRCVVFRNEVKGNWNGICLYHSFNSSIFENEVAGNYVYGIAIVGQESSGNVIFHNNILNNRIQGYIVDVGVPNSWDNGYPSGGNYWSDYSGTDLFCGPDQNETGADGIGDTPFAIDANNTDNYPLIAYYSPTTLLNTSITKGGETHEVQVVSDDTVLDFKETPGSIRLKVSGESGTAGYVRVTQPIGLNSTNIRVFLNNTKLSFPSNDPPRSISTNGTHYFIYFAFTYNSICEVTVAFPIEGDVDYSGAVNIHDASLLAAAYGSEPQDSNWNPHVDTVGTNGIIDIFDLFKVAAEYGETWPQ